MSIQLQDESKLNVIPIRQPIKIHLADFPIGSPEFELMKQNFKHHKAAVLLQHLEFLNRHYGVPLEGVFRNIFPSGNLPHDKTISGHIGIKSRRLLFPILAEIREHYTFKKGIKLDPREIDFNGKLYATYYLPSHPYRTVYWFRNAKLIDEFCAEIERKLVNLKQARDAIYIVPREPACELKSGIVSEPPSEPSGEPSYINKLKKKKIEEIKTKEKKDPLPEDIVINQNLGEELLNKQTNTVVEGIKSKNKSKIKTENTCISYGMHVYRLYKTYCESADKGILMTEVPSVSEAKALENFSKVFNDLGFKQQQLPEFFGMLGLYHYEIIEYLEVRGVWQIKNHIIFFNCAFISNNAELFLSCYKKYQNELGKNTSSHAKLTKKESKYALSEPKKKICTPLNSVGFTYEKRMKNIPEDEIESMEYFFVFHGKYMEEHSVAANYMQMLEKESIDLDASMKKIEQLRALSEEEFKNIPYPR